ncbi:DUF342 domain-containing protein [Pseudoalteromonas denitrificans]|uniref:Flagellar Assembly Protein A N-terminal region domain-containing protein n=1 Tax=Pseudoalteromonas denitrificans DSM 6059 TaxID=1123010 RepID=A0A1I1P666_9GAMM|nr:FapA family protein [Pseudoalteromonas denitrificans]SFD03148.1 hypothetical protein SAMN02745724_03259 [Pseudoalteromonas denitrificans DSM 6059]
MFKLISNNQVQLIIDNDYPFPASSDFILQALNASAYCEFEIHEDEIKEFIKNHNESIELIVATKKDATLEIEIAEDKMSAEGILITPQGGKLVDLDSAKAMLIKAGITRGYKQVYLEKLLQQQLNQPAGTKCTGVLASGKQPEAGRDATLEKKVSTLSDRLRKPKLLEDGRVDMLDFGKLASVKPGTILLTKIFETAGKDGYTITGDTIKAKPGQTTKLVAGEGTEIKSNKPNELIAIQSGVPIEINNGMRVDDIYSVESVSVKTGHIDFDGSVLITKNIEPNMKVNAKGNICVLGTVESAELIATGDITIKQGVIGHQNKDNEYLSCKISCHGELELGHAQYTFLKAKNIHIERLASHCHLKAKNLINVGNKDHPMGKLIGGKVLDARRIKLGELGCESGAKIELHLIQDAFKLKDSNEKLLQQQVKTEQHLVELQEALEKVENTKASEQKEALFNKITATHHHWIVQAEKISEKSALFEEYLHQLLEAAEIEVNQKLYPGVELHLFDKVLKTKRIYAPCQMKLREGKIKIDFKT